MPTPDGYITREEFEAWKHNPVTLMVMREVDAVVARTAEYMGGGGTVDGNNADFTAQNTSYYVGYIKGLRDALRAPFSVITPEDDVEE